MNLETYQQICINQQIMMLILSWISSTNIPFTLQWGILPLSASTIYINEACSTVFSFPWRIWENKGAADRKMSKYKKKTITSEIQLIITAGERNQCDMCL